MCAIGGVAGQRIESHADVCGRRKCVRERCEAPAISRCPYGRAARGQRLPKSDHYACGHTARPTFRELAIAAPTLVGRWGPQSNHSERGSTRRFDFGSYAMITSNLPSAARRLEGRLRERPLVATSPSMIAPALPQSLPVAVHPKPTANPVRAGWRTRRTRCPERSDWPSRPPALRLAPARAPPGARADGHRRRISPARRDIPHRRTGQPIAGGKRARTRLAGCCRRGGLSRSRAPHGRTRGYRHHPPPPGRQRAFPRWTALSPSRDGGARGTRSGGSVPAALLFALLPCSVGCCGLTHHGLDEG